MILPRIASSLLAFAMQVVTNLILPADLDRLYVLCAGGLVYVMWDHLDDWIIGKFE